MPEIKSAVPLKAKMHLVLRGPDGEIKDERKSREPKITEEHRDGNKKQV
jgi:hypothetical protein